MNFRSLFFALIFLLASAPAQAQNPEEAAILETIQHVFDGINEKNADLIRQSMMPDGILYATFLEEDSPAARYTSAEDFAAGITEAESVYHERMFEHELHVQDGVALVWAAYDFHIDGNFSHCGVDTFSLVKTGDNWRVAALTYTVEREGCAERPPLPSSSN